jgi:pimeloyl-ACP methyl ester carboxylesterase
MRINGADLHVEDTGGAGPAIVFSHGLLWSTTQWRFQVAAFRGSHRCIAYDHRGQGKSEVTESGYDMDTLTEDAAALIDRLRAAPAHFVGLSMGGFVGMRLAARRRELLRSLVLVDTANDAEPWVNVPKYAAMSFLTRFLGTGPFVPAVMKIMFGRTFREDRGRAELRNGLVRELLCNDVAGMRRAVDGVILRKPVSDEEMARIDLPTLVISGTEDVAVVPERSMRTASRIRGAKFLPIARAGHSSSIEEPEAVNQALRSFWESLAPAAAARS